MIDIGVKEIADAVSGELTSSSVANEVISGISIDSRTIQPGEVFIAISGENADGHDYISQAVAAGAVGVVSERSRAEVELPAQIYFIRVGNSIDAMKTIAAYIRDKIDIPVVAITGTNGKTTVKDILQCLLSKKYKTYKSPLSYNNKFGISLTLFGINKSHSAAVFEIGTNHPGEIADLTRLVRPSYAVITNVGAGHLEFFGNTDGVFREKISILDHLPADGIGFLNGDDVRLREAATDIKKIVFFGKTPGCDFHVTDILKREDGYDFSLNGEVLHIPLVGEHNVNNAAAAIAVAVTMGVEYNVIRKGLLEVSLPEMRMKKSLSGGLIFLNDAYNANPDSFECALKTLEDMDSQGRKWVISGDMLELGSRSDELHRELGERIASKNFDFLITLGDAGMMTASGAIEAGMNDEHVFCSRDHEGAALLIRTIARLGDVILLKGSRKMRMEEILKCYITSCTR